MMYAVMLGVRLPATMVQTEDIDVAQFADVSAAIGDTTRPMAEVLREVDASFRAVPHVDPHRVGHYAAASGLRVDFLTPNRGRHTEQPRKLPALGTDAQPLRFLDFLIRDPEPAVLLHGGGILVSVPAPQRYALHKLIVARRRREGDAKRDEDCLQAQASPGRGSGGGHMNCVPPGSRRSAAAERGGACLARAWGCCIPRPVILCCGPRPRGARRYSRPRPVFRAGTGWL